MCRSAQFYDKCREQKSVMEEPIEILGSRWRVRKLRLYNISSYSWCLCGEQGNWVYMIVGLPLVSICSKPDIWVSLMGKITEMLCSCWKYRELNFC